MEFTPLVLPPHCIGEKCWCGNQAHHKIEHDTLKIVGVLFSHPLTAYVCHDHFVQLMGPLAEKVWG